MKFSNESTLEKILEQEGAEEVLNKHGVPCVHCPRAKYELSQLEIGDVCGMYGLDDKAILEDLNKK